MRFILLILLCVCSQTLLAGAALPIQKELKYAKNFSITEHATHTLLTVRNAYRNASQEFRYALVPKEAALPEDLPEGSTLVRTPIENVALMETVYVGYLDAIDQLGSIRAAATAQYISHPQVTAQVASGDIAELQSGQNVNIEKLLLLQPEVIFTTTLGDGSFERSPQLQRAGLTVVLTADYMESHPLARAEWIRFIAAFFEKDAEAQRLFEEVEAEYIRLTQLTESVEAQPTVFCGAPYTGVWHVPGGQSYIAQMIEDAGGDYLWTEDASQGGLPLDTERVFLKAADADFWIHPSYYRSLNALFGADPRFSKFEAAQAGKVYNNTRQVNARGGNNIWEEGIINPQDVLADLIQIFHSDLFPERDLVYHEQLQ